MNLSLKVKLIGGFTIVALIALVIGIIGWWGVDSTAGKMTDIADVRMLRVTSLLNMAQQFRAIIGAQRTLLNPDLTKEQRASEFQNIVNARDIYKAVSDKFAASLTTEAEKAKRKMRRKRIKPRRMAQPTRNWRKRLPGSPW